MHHVWRYRREYMFNLARLMSLRRICFSAQIIFVCYLKTPCFYLIKLTSPMMMSWHGISYRVLVDSDHKEPVKRTFEVSSVINFNKLWIKSGVDAGFRCHDAHQSHLIYKTGMTKILKSYVFPFALIREVQCIITIYHLSLCYPLCLL